MVFHEVRNVDDVDMAGMGRVGRRDPLATVIVRDEHVASSNSWGNVKRQKRRHEIKRKGN